MSSKSILQKLHLKNDQKFLLVDVPSGYLESLGKLPNGVRLSTEPEGEADAIQLFVTKKSDLEKLKQLKPLLSQRGILWIIYPKGTSKMKTDINRDTIRVSLQTVGLKAVAIFSVDANWAAIRLKRL